MVNGDVNLVRYLGPGSAWLFDLDDTLVHSGRVHEQAFHTAIAAHSPDALSRFSYEAGRTTLEQMHGVIGDGELAYRAAKTKQDEYRRLLKEGAVTAIDGSNLLMSLLNGLGVHLYLVTSGSRTSVDLVLKHCDLVNHFRGVLTGDDVVNGKPNPEIYIEARRLWRVPMTESLVVEDSFAGVLAALSAGFVTVHVTEQVSDPHSIAMKSITDLAETVDRAVNSA